MHVFTVETGAAGFQRGGHDQGIVKAEPELRVETQAARVQRARGVDPPQGREHIVQQQPHAGRLRAQLAGHHMQRLLNDLIADAACPIFQAAAHQTFSALTLVGGGFIEQIDEDVGVDEVFSAHSSHRA